MLKKYSDYINKNKRMELSSVSDISNIKESNVKEPIVKEPIVKEPIVKEPIVKKSNIKHQKNKTKISKNINEKINFNGKIVLFSNSNIKPSSIISLLETKNISKKKLHYIIIEQKNSFVLLKYNLDTKLNIKLFIENFIKYHKNKINIDNNISLNVSDTFAIIKNISEKHKHIYINNIIKLLK